MKILVPIKRVIDHNVKIRFKSDGDGIETANVKMSMNPFDEVAVEQAVRMKENGTADEVVVVTIGSAKAADVLYAAMAMGADRAVHVSCEEKVQQLDVAKILVNIVQSEQVDLVLTGKQATDDDAGLVGGMMAGMLDWGTANSVSSIEVVDATTIKIGREINGGIERLEMDLPCLLTADLSIATPRYAALPAILQARKKPLETLTLSQVGMTELSSRLTVLSVEPPQKRGSVTMVSSVDELVDKLRSEAGVL